jgi:hypothetical protein
MLRTVAKEKDKGFCYHEEELYYTRHLEKNKMSKVRHKATMA